MVDGLLLVWVELAQKLELIKAFEELRFFVVEQVTYVALDPKLSKASEEAHDIS